MDVADQGTVKKRFRFRPELITGFTVSFRVGDEGRYQLQNVLFAVNVGEGVIVHGLLEVDRVEDFDFVVIAFKQLANLADHAALGVGYDVGAVHLHKVGFEEEPRLTGTRTADDKHVLVSCVLGFFGSVRHHKAFRLRKDDVVFKHGVHKRCNVLSCTPTSRTILDIFAVLLGVLAFEIHHKSDDNSYGNTNKQINRVEARHDVLKRHRNALHDVHSLGGKINARRETSRLSELCGEQTYEHIRNIGQNELFIVHVLHRASSSFLRTFGVSMSAATSLNFRSFLSTEGRSFLRSVFAVYSLNAAVRASASRALKKTRYLGISPVLSFFRAKSTPYFLAIRSKSLIFLSVISMFETP